MRRVSSAQIGIEQGSHVLFSDFVDDGPMWTGSGPRECRYDVMFEKPFSDPPAVHVSISMWDMDNQTNQRGDLKAENITRTGFDLVFRTWGDSRVARVRAEWMVMGALPNDDDWELY